MPSVRVRNEHAALKTAIVHGGGNAIDITMDDYRRLVPAEELANHPESGPSSRTKLFEQHARFRKLLADQGVALVSPDSQKDAFCQVFTRDPCFAVGDTLFVGGLRDEWRHPETAGLGGIRESVGRVVPLSDGGATIEGGDVMVLDPGNRVLVGMNRHTNEAGFRLLANALGGSVEVVAVPHHALHLDCCLAPLPNGEALYAANKLPDASLAVLGRYFSRLVPLDPCEAALHLAANVFWIDERRVVSGVAPKKTNALLRDMRYEVFELDFSDLVSLWGSFRCVVCPLERT
jgi:N-dimethylarginine dimethylaminohydrolase